VYTTDRSFLAPAEHAYARAIDLEHRGHANCVDQFFQAAALAWPFVERQLGVRPIPSGRASQIYHSSLIKLITAGQCFRRLDPKGGIQVCTSSGWLTIPTSYHGFPWQPEDFDYLIPVGCHTAKDLHAAYRSCGLGVATVVMHCRRPHEQFRRERQFFAATAVLRPVVAEARSNEAPFVLELYDPVRLSSTTAAGQVVSLRRDITAPIAYLLSNTRRRFIRNFLQPGSTTENSGLFMIEPYQPGKIPVVFVHGLLSDPFTWVNLANEIRARPDLIERYQIWGFEYATGEPFLKSAAVLRRQLLEVQAQIDPHATDPALFRTVLVGHSMGGLISKLQVTYSGNALWRSVSSCPLDRIVTKSSTRAALADSFYFDPSAMVSRVVFAGTPHRGSPWASGPIGHLGELLVSQPSSMKEAHRQLIRDNPRVFSREFTRRIPTSIDLLEPESPLLNAIDRLPFASYVQLHSIIGRGHWMVGAGDSDNVVPVASARQSGVVTERFIKARHIELPMDVASIQELFCILRRHIQEFDIVAAPEL
jgi:pimeloyl-ACP methyl ester carboxylesterase